MRDGAYSKAKATFQDFKAQNRQRELAVEDQTTELRRFARYEAWLRRPEICPNQPLGRRLRDVKMLEVTTAHPLLMHLLDRHESGQIDDDTLLGCIDDLSSFVLRRSICGESSRGYGRWFPEAIKAIAEDPRESLRQYWLRRGWPDDEAFVPTLVEFPLYRREAEKAKLLLQTLERSHEHKEPVDLAKLTIEHVMPQKLTGKHGRAWKEMLGENWQRTHERLLHTLGNLTLTGYNADMSNRPFPDKKAWFAETHVDLNRVFADLATWDGRAIRARGKALAAQVAQTWPRPEGVEYVPGRPTKTRKLRASQRKAYWASFLASDEWSGFVRAQRRGHGHGFRCPGPLRRGHRNRPMIPGSSDPPRRVPG